MQITQGPKKLLKPILWNETVSEIDFSSLTSLPEDQRGTPNLQNTQKMKDHFKTLGQQKATLKEIELGALYKYFNNDNSHVNMNRGWSACGTHEGICHYNMLLQLLA